MPLSHCYSAVPRPGLPAQVLDSFDGIVRRASPRKVLLRTAQRSTARSIVGLFGCLILSRAISAEGLKLRVAHTRSPPAAPLQDLPFALSHPQPIRTQFPSRLLHNHHL